MAWNSRPCPWLPRTSRSASRAYSIASAPDPQRPDDVLKVNANKHGRGGDDEWDPALMVPGTPTLREHLLQQAGCLRLSDRDRVLHILATGRGR